MKKAINRLTARLMIGSLTRLRILSKPLAGIIALFMWFSRLSKRKVYKAILLFVSIICIVLLAVQTIQYDMQTNGNCVTALSGLWSAAATLGIGIIAYWQNQRYKKLADEANDLIYKPEIIIPNTVLDQQKAMTASVSNTIKPQLNTYSYRAEIKPDDCISLEAIAFQVVKPPIIQFSITTLNINGGYYNYSCEEKTLTETSQYFSVLFSIPGKYADYEDKLHCKVWMQYSNLYGTRYEKKMSFNIEPHTNIPSNIQLENAERIS